MKAVRQLRGLIMALMVVSFAGVRGAEPIGLVLSGGGGKGAYEIGVWQAICERGLDKRITAISGTSVGALNGALFALVQDPQKCRNVWNDVSRRAFRLDLAETRRVIEQTGDDVSNQIDRANAERERRIQDVRRRKHREPTQDELDAIDDDLKLKGALTVGGKLLVRLLKRFGDSVGGETNVTGYIDSDNLRRELTACLPTEWPQACPQVYAVAVNKGTGRKHAFALRGLPQQAVVDRLMASSAIPLGFDTVKIDNELYVDGGVRDNTPVWPIVDNHKDIRQVIVVMLDNGCGEYAQMIARNLPNVHLTFVLPSGKISGPLSVFDTSPKTSQRLIEMGYHDAVKALKAID